MRSREARSAPPGADQAHGLRHWCLNQPLRPKGMILVAVPPIALMACPSENLLLQQDESHERDISTNARNLAAAASQVLADAANAETGIRGYTATRDPLFLAPYTLTLTRIGAERKALREAAVIAGAGRQQRAVDATTGKVLFQLAQLKSAVSPGISAESLIRAQENEKATMDLLRRQVADLTAGTTALVAVQHTKIIRLQTRTELLDIAGLV